MPSPPDDVGYNKAAIVDGKWRSLADFLAALGFRIDPESVAGPARS